MLSTMRKIRKGNKRKVVDWEDLKVKAQNRKGYINIAMLMTMLTGKKVLLGLYGIDHVK